MLILYRGSLYPAQGESVSESDLLLRKSNIILQLSDYARACPKRSILLWPVQVACSLFYPKKEAKENILVYSAQIYNIAYSCQFCNTVEKLARMSS